MTTPTWGFGVSLTTEVWIGDIEIGKAHGSSLEITVAETT
jgi:hypothetical protein